VSQAHKHEINQFTIDENGIALDAWYPIAMKLMKNAVPHTNAGNKKELRSICFIHTFPVHTKYYDKHKFS
jgi:hypothetical protein